MKMYPGKHKYIQGKYVYVVFWMYISQHLEQFVS